MSIHSSSAKYYNKIDDNKLPDMVSFLLLLSTNLNNQVTSISIVVVLHPIAHQLRGSLSIAAQQIKFVKVSTQCFYSDSVFHCVPDNPCGDRSNNLKSQTNSVQIFQCPFPHSVPTNNAKISQKHLVVAILDRTTVF